MKTNNYGFPGKEYVIIISCVINVVCEVDQMLIEFKWYILLIH